MCDMPDNTKDEFLMYKLDINTSDKKVYDEISRILELSGVDHDNNHFLSIKRTQEEEYYKDYSNNDDESSYKNYNISLETTNKKVYDEIKRLMELSGIRNEDESYFIKDTEEKEFYPKPSSEKQKTYGSEEQLDETEVTSRFDADKQRKISKEYNINFSNINQNGRATIKNRITMDGNNEYYDVMKEKWKSFKKNRKVDESM